MGRTWTPSQEAAMNISGKTLLVSAAAGSGKTSVLTERIIRSLTDPEHPADLSRMLVVTFTRAAAAELKGRIASALTDAMAENPDNKFLSRQLFLLGSAQISTIDSFFQKAVRANFEQLSLPASFRPADEHEILPISLEILDGLIEEYYRAYTQNDGKDSPFERLRDNRFAHAIDHLISDRSDGRLNSVLLEFLESFSADPDGVGVLRECAKQLKAESEQEYLSTSYGSIIRAHLSDLFGGYEAFLRRTLAHLDATPDMMAKCGGIVESDASFCRAILQALKDGSYARLREVAFTFITGKFPTVKNKTNELILYQEWRTKLKASVKKVQEMLAPTEQRIHEEMQATAELCEMLFRFYTDFETRLMAEKTERGILEYNDVRAMLYRLLTSPDGSPTPFAESLASQYDAVYIDEYQDVDLLQDRIFAMIGGNHRFMVGDIKQSIYGFRGSEPSIFAGYRRAMPLYTDEGADTADGNCVFMSENFRCDRPVINFANKICAFLFSACEESVGYREQDDLVCSKPSPETLPDGHPVPVSVEIFDAPPRKSSRTPEDEDSEEEREREEAGWVASEISRLLREETLDNGSAIRPEDIAILVRNRTHGDTYARELKKLNVPVAASAAADLLHDPILTDLLNLLRTIDNPYRDLPLSEYLLSPFGGFIPEELNEIRDSSSDNGALYDALLEKAMGADGLSQKCRALDLWMQNQRENAAVQPADRFLRLLYLDERLADYANHPAALFLYEQARAYQKSAFCGLYAFLSHFDKLMAGGKLSADGFSKAESAVTVMTVHHSKGLEFPVVFLCNLGSPFNREDAKRTLVYHRAAGCATRLYNRETGESEDTALRTAVKLRINEEQTEESIRTLYVALTRARERMYVTGTLSGKWDSACTSASLIGRSQRAAILSVSNPLQWILASLEESVAQFETEDWKLTHHLFGTVEEGLPYLHSSPIKETEAVLEGSPTARRYADVLARRASFVYPQEHLHMLPSKIAASKIRSDLLETLDSDEDNTALDMQIELMHNTTPSFDVLLNTERKPSAAEIGTATHIFMELCDYHSLVQNGVDSECERLVAGGFLTREGVGLLNRSHLEKFRTSDLMELIKEAKSIRREQKFSLLLPASKLTSDPALAEQIKGETVFVQGSIDLLLQMSDGKTVLIDYKTDRIPKEELADMTALTRRMMASHGEQLAAYARAIAQMFGNAPSDIRIYSLPLGRTIPLSTEELLKKADLD